MVAIKTLAKKLGGAQAFFGCFGEPEGTFVRLIFETVNGEGRPVQAIGILIDCDACFHTLDCSRNRRARREPQANPWVIAKPAENVIAGIADVFGDFEPVPAGPARGLPVRGFLLSRCWAAAPRRGKPRWARFGGRGLDGVLVGGRALDGIIAVLLVGSLGSRPRAILKIWRIV